MQTFSNVLLFKSVCVVYGVCVCCLQKLSESDHPEARVTVGCEQTAMGAGDQTWVLYMLDSHSRVISLPPSPLFVVSFW